MFGIVGIVLFAVVACVALDLWVCVNSNETSNVPYYLRERGERRSRSFVNPSDNDYIMVTERAGEFNTTTLDADASQVLPSPPYLPPPTEAFENREILGDLALNQTPRDSHDYSNELDIRK